MIERRPLSIRALAHVASLLLIAAVVCGVVLRVAGMAPSGADPGNWLALAAELQGSPVKAAQIEYPPLIPLLVAVAELWLPPLVAVRSVGLFALAMAGVGLAIAFARSLGWRWSIACGLVFDLSGYALEMSAWGGYPQLLATGFFLIGATSLNAFLSSGARHDLFITALGLGLTAATSHLVLLEAGTTCIAIAALRMLLFVESGRALLLKRAATAAGLAAVAALPVFPLYIRMVQSAVPAFGRPGEFDLETTLSTLVWEARTPWLAMVVLAAGAAIVDLRRHEMSITFPLMGLTLGSITAFVLMSFEIRLLLPLLVVAPLGAAALLRRVRGRLHPWRAQLAPSLAAGIFVLCGLPAASGGVARLATMVPQYGPVTAEMEEALLWLRTNTPEGTVTAASPSERLFILSWWVEGLGHRPSYGAIDPRWLNFPEERRQAAVANAIFAQPEVHEAAILAGLHGVQFLVVDREWALTRGHFLSPNWPQVETAFENQVISVFRVSDEVPTLRQMQIAEIYRNVLHREPDPTGLLAYDASGLDPRGIELSLYCSPESTAFRPEREESCAGRTDSEKERQAAISSLYLAVLGRPPDPVGLETYAQGSLDLAAVERALRCSPEYALSHPDSPEDCP